MTFETPLQNSASRILAAALSDCLPGHQLYDVGPAMGGFYCDFFFNGPITAALMTQLEERMRQIIREQRPIQMLEMIPSCASEMLKKSGQPRRALQASQQKGLVQLVQIAPFVDWSQGGHLRHTRESGFIRLLDKQILEKGRIRIFGVAAQSKKELTAHAIRWKQLPSQSHEAKADLWQMISGERVWLEKGLAARRQLCDYWRKAFSSLTREVEGIVTTHPVVARSQDRPILVWMRVPESDPNIRGLLDDRYPLVLQIKSFSLDEKSYISFLQTVHRSLTILGLTFRVQFIGKKQGLFRSIHSWNESIEFVSGPGERVLFLVPDAMECEWCVAEVRDPRRNGGLFLTLWVERNLALLLEKFGSPKGWDSAGEMIEN